MGLKLCLTKIVVGCLCLILTQIQPQNSGVFGESRLFHIKMKLQKTDLLYLSLRLIHLLPFTCSLDPAMSFKGLSRALVPELAVDQQLLTVSSCTLPLPKDCDLDTESTVL